MVMVVVVTAMAVLVRMAEVKVVAVAVQVQQKGAQGAVSVVPKQEQTAAKQGQVGPVATGMVQQRRREEKVGG